MKTLEQLVSESVALFSSRFQQAPLLTAFAPGRINIIGEHTDYNQGLSMPCAINRWVLVSMKPADDGSVRVFSQDFDEAYEGEWATMPQPQSMWQRYVHGCLQLFFERNSFHSGCSMVIQGNVPIGSGVSSSAALEVAVMNALNGWYGKPLDALQLIRECQRVEHEHMHVKSGLLDQYASQFSKAGTFLALDFLNTTHEEILSAINGYTWMLCDSGVKRELASSKYTERVEETAKGLQFIQQQDATVHSFRDLREQHLALLENEVWKKRLRHYLSENARVRLCAVALKEGNAVATGIQVTASHVSLRDDYEVSCEELDFLVEHALALPYCLGSRMMGGGFGGCTLNLVQEGHEEDFSRYMEDVFSTRFHRPAKISQYQLVDGAGFLIH